MFTFIIINYIFSFVNSFFTFILNLFKMYNLFFYL
nr:MAG TPA: hypothetical protein [Caudoviricetes sp.]